MRTATDAEILKESGHMICSEMGVGPEVAQTGWFQGKENLSKIFSVHTVTLVHFQFLNFGMNYLL